MPWIDKGKSYHTCSKPAEKPGHGAVWQCDDCEAKWVWYYEGYPNGRWSLPMSIWERISLALFLLCPIVMVVIIIIGTG